MKIYQLVQVSWGDGKFTDFALPRIIGHWDTYDKAKQRIRVERQLHVIQKDLADRTLDTDYRIYEIEVL